MDELKRKLQEILQESPSRFVISNPKPDSPVRKVLIRKVQIRGELVYQIEKLTEKQAFHENVNEEALLEHLLEIMENFRQMDVWTDAFQYGVKISKKGKVLSNRHKVQGNTQPASTSHNREKQYLLPEGTPIAPLVDLGVFTKDGYIVRTMYDKYKQIHRFVELIDDVIKEEKKERPLRIIDFGCGKSYLTFILYYFLTEVRGRKVEVTGLDLKEDVIRHCNEVAKRYGYEHLHFQIGDIADYDTSDPVDMVISLHACDTATDYALYNAIRWKARMIFSVPCCQHEINGQLSDTAMPSVTQYGILKERMAALLTDGIRADLLKSQGYQVQVLEFIDLAHSPKNLLIRARYTGHKNENALKQAAELIDVLKIQPTLYTLLKEDH